MKNIEVYLKTLNENTHFIQYLFTETGDRLLNKLKVSEELLSKSHDFHIHKINQKIILLFNLLVQRIKTPAELKDIDSSQLVQILGLQNENLSKEKEVINDLLKLCNNDKQIVNAILKERSFDYLYLDTSFEKEDIIVAVQRQQENQQVAQLILQYHNKQKRLIELDFDFDLQSMEVKPPNIDLDGQYLAVDSILNIIYSVIEVIASDYEIMTRSDREKRRANMSNFARYISFRKVFVEGVERLVAGGQKKVLDILGIKQELWDQSLKYYTDQNKQEILWLPMLIIDKLKRSSIKGKKKLSEEELVAVLKYQLELTQADEEKKKEAGEDDLTKSLIEVQVLDKIFEKYNVEEEDILLSIREYGENENVKQLLSKF